MVARFRRSPPCGGVRLSGGGYATQSTAPADADADAHAPAHAPAAQIAAAALHRAACAVVGGLHTRHRRRHSGHLDIRQKKGFGECVEKLCGVERVFRGCGGCDADVAALSRTSTRLAWSRLKNGPRRTSAGNGDTGATPADNGRWRTGELPRTTVAAMQCTRARQEHASGSENLAPRHAGVGAT